MAEIPNLSLFKRLFEHENSRSFQFTAEGDLSSQTAKYTGAQAIELAKEAGREFGNMLAALRQDFGRKGTDRGPTTNFLKRNDEIAMYRVDMMFTVFEALFTVIDRVTRLEIELKDISAQARSEKEELLGNTKGLANFIENNLINPFFMGFKESNLPVTSSTRGKTLEEMRINAIRMSTDLGELFGKDAHQYTEAREEASKRIFTAAA